MEGFIKIHRNLLEWRWYHHSAMVHLLIHLLLRANYADKEWGLITIKRGQLVTSRLSLCRETGLSEKVVRNSLQKLVQTGEIEMKATNRHTLITVVNYDDYQGLVNAEGQQKAGNRPTDGHQKAITGEKKVMKKRKEESSPLSLFPEMVLPEHTEESEIDFGEFERFFNEKVNGTSIPKICRLESSSKRQTSLKRLAKEFGVDKLKEVVEKTIKSEFLRGDKGQWKANFDWLFTPKNFQKVLEGNYDDNHKTHKYGNNIISNHSAGNTETISAGIEIFAEMEREEGTDSQEVFR